MGFTKSELTYTNVIAVDLPMSSCRYIFSADGKYILGGMMVGDTSDYVKLLALVKKKVSHRSVTCCFGDFTNLIEST